MKMKGEKMERDRPLSAKTCTDTQEVKISEWRGKCMYDDAHIYACADETASVSECCVCDISVAAHFLNIAYGVAY